MIKFTKYKKMLSHGFEIWCCSLIKHTDIKFWIKYVEYLAFQKIIVLKQLQHNTCNNFWIMLQTSLENYGFVQIFVYYYLTHPDVLMIMQVVLSNYSHTKIHNGHEIRQNINISEIIHKNWDMGFSRNAFFMTWWSCMQSNLNHT